MSAPLTLVGTRAALQVLVVDDHRVFAEALAQRLSLVATVADARVACTLDEARAAVGRLGPDVVLLAWRLGQHSWLDLLEHLDDLPLRSRVVVLGDGTTPPATVLERLPEPGAWVSKEASFEDLLAALAGQRPSGPDQGDPRVVDPPTRRPARPVEDAVRARLSERQAQVLGCLADGMTRAEVADALGMSRHTVRDHVRHLFRVAEVATTPDLVAHAGGPARSARDAEPPALRMVPDP